MKKNKIRKSWAFIICLLLLFCFCTQNPVKTLCQKEMTGIRAIWGDPEKVNVNKGKFAFISWWYYKDGICFTFKADLLDYTACRISTFEFPSTDMKKKSDRIRLKKFFDSMADSLLGKTKK